MVASRHNQRVRSRRQGRPPWQRGISESGVCAPRFVLLGVGLSQGGGAEEDEEVVEVEEKENRTRARRDS